MWKSDSVCFVCNMWERNRAKDYVYWEIGARTVIYTEWGCTLDTVRVDVHDHTLW